ncbi:unnamed protein product [Protopolystoma xenopodis]|uniref:Uncharacterized protein n=1 Tax=Protopolystoma xenopodis TaxID=117903 RepID=A0A3S5CHU2_9PLAT|nr:unnamed protein product [Protopolystoma xenopodis]
MHPKESQLGSKLIWLGPRVFVEADDAACFVEGDCVTFINWGNLLITKIFRASDSGAVISVEAQLKLEDTDFKKTQKVTWLADSSNVPDGAGLFCPVACIVYGNLITNALIGKDEDFKKFVNYNSKEETCLLAEPCLRSLKKGDIIQFQRRGFYICDEPYQASQ